MSDRPAVAPACQRGENVGRRRTLLRAVAGTVLAWLAPHQAQPATQDATRARPVAGDLLVRIGDTARTPLTVSDLRSGDKPVMAWPMSPDGTLRSGSRLNRILLVRLDPAAFTAPTRPRVAEGVVAYSAICTHSGCDVGDFLADEQQLYCECHQTRFDPRDGARVTDGPAPRPLPALPLQVDDGRLVVAAAFTSRPGFEQGIA